MAYSTDVMKAMKLATEAHEGQVDKANTPYIGHPRRVAGRVDTDEEKVVAWLHDVVEDTDISMDTIRTEFGNETASAVEAITHRKGESWSDYLSRARANEISRAVKIADLIDNSNLSRLKKITPKDVIRQAKYNRALYYLMDVDGE